MKLLLKLLIVIKLMKFKIFNFKWYFLISFLEFIKKKYIFYFTCLLTLIEIGFVGEDSRTVVVQMTGRSRCTVTLQPFPGFHFHFIIQLHTSAPPPTHTHQVI